MRRKIRSISLLMALFLLVLTSIAGCSATPEPEAVRPVVQVVSANETVTAGTHRFAMTSELTSIPIDQSALGIRVRFQDSGSPALMPDDIVIRAFDSNGDELQRAKLPGGVPLGGVTGMVTAPSPSQHASQAPGQPRSDGYVDAKFQPPGDESAITIEVAVDGNVEARWRIQ